MSLVSVNMLVSLSVFVSVPRLPGPGFGIQNLLRPASLRFYTNRLSILLLILHLWFSKSRIGSRCVSIYALPRSKDFSGQEALSLTSRTAMQDVMHEYVALWTEIVGAVRASVPAEWANPIRSGIR